MRKLEQFIGIALMLIATIGMIAMMSMMARNLPPEAAQVTTITTEAPLVSPTETIPPNTGLPTLTPSRTLLPPPTFEPPTLTPFPSLVPTLTPIPTLNYDVEVPEGLHGLESATPVDEEACQPHEDWTLIYEVQAFDTLEQIANKYGTFTSDLVSGNCIEDPNVISIGQKVRVPGTSHPATPAVVCTPWEVLTPINNASNVDGDGQLSFNWRGPRAERNLIRVIKPDGTIWERTVDLRQNETINLAEELPAAGIYYWYVYPLDSGFRQIACLEGGPWMFQKTAATEKP